ncbi:MAG: glycosyltransferase family 2 protein [Spirochaetales bacterium]|nr:glycosyltransferase family 2 protein [Spirochaetales bacterium]
MKISCIIPAYNEAETIGNVLTVIKGHPLLQEIIVVDDGSSDNTSGIVKKFSFVKLITCKKNCGKASAVKKAVEASRSNIILLLDADLIHLTKQDITRLIRPVTEGDADITISLRKLKPILNEFVRIVKMDIFTGDRCFKKDLLANLPITKNTPGYSLEVMMNDYILKNDYKLIVVDFKHVRCLYKVDKIGILKGLQGEIKMFRQILKVMTFKEMVRQYYRMIKRRTFLYLA